MRRKIALAPISLAEVVYLMEKKRLPASSLDDLRRALVNPNHVLEEAPLTSDVVEASALSILVVGSGSG